MHGRLGCIAVVQGAHTVTAHTLVGLAEYLLHNRCDLNAFGARDTLRDTPRDTLTRDTLSTSGS